MKDIFFCIFVFLWCSWEACTRPMMSDWFELCSLSKLDSLRLRLLTFLFFFWCNSDAACTVWHGFFWAWNKNKLKKEIWILLMKLLHRLTWLYYIWSWKPWKTSQNVDARIQILKKVHLKLFVFQFAPQ